MTETDNTTDTRVAESATWRLFGDMPMSGTRRGSDAIMLFGGERAAA